MNTVNEVLISPIKEMEIRSVRIPGVVSLAQGIPSFDTPECVKRKAIEAIQDGKVARYSLSPGLLELREAIEYDLSKQNIFYDFENEIIITAGSIEAITATFLTILEPGDEVLIPDPTYTSYQSAIKTARGVPVFIPLNEDRGWTFNIEQLKKRITPKTKAILYCNPNNPTGTVYGRNQLMQIVELAELHNLYILSDEVYKDFLYDRNEEFFTLAKLQTFRKRFVYIFSFSKAYAMTGWRVAYLATDKKLARKILGVHDALVTCAPVVSQWAALAALEMAKSDIDAYRTEFKHRRKLICRKLDGMSEWLEYEKPSSAYFIFPKMTKKCVNEFADYQKQHPFKTDDTKPHQIRSLSWRFSLELLNKVGTVVVPGVAFGPTGENHIRLCFGQKRRDIIKAMDRIKRFFEQIQRSNRDNPVKKHNEKNI
ncbi:MAG: pyridoxal phosphate-dependent aminotransferase [Patescibacteria group bacterium]|nr:pyridoxal phosphate-dependent aminotransferase [Patescibacteria group bacterium]